MTTYEATPLCCPACHARLGVLLPGGYFRSEHRGREFLMYLAPGTYAETTCGARRGGSDRLCGHRTVIPAGEPC